MLVCGLPKNVFSQPADQSAPSKSEVVSPAYEPYGPFGDYPGSIIDELREDAKRKDYLFQLPGADRVLRPWYAFKSYLDDKYWFRFAVSFAALYQKASDTVTGADEAAGLDLGVGRIGFDAVVDKALHALFPQGLENRVDDSELHQHRVGDHQQATGTHLRDGMAQLKGGTRAGKKQWPRRLQNHQRHVRQKDSEPIKPVNQ